jgi:hypothetical protein
MPRWSTYVDLKSGNEVIFKTACLTAEDSAAHLKLRVFTDTSATGRRRTSSYGCYKRGY